VRIRYSGAEMFTHLLRTWIGFLELTLRHLVRTHLPESSPCLYLTIIAPSRLKNNNRLSIKFFIRLLKSGSIYGRWPFCWYQRLELLILLSCDQLILPSEQDIHRFVRNVQAPHILLINLPAYEVCFLKLCSL